MFVDVGAKSDGFVHISNSNNKYFVWQLFDKYQAGDEIDVWVNEVKPNERRLHLQLYPYLLDSEEMAQKRKSFRIEDYQIGDVLPGKVIKFSEYGAYVDIGAPFSAFIHRHKMKSNRRQRKYKSWEIYPFGTEIEGRIYKIDPLLKRIELTTFEPEVWDWRFPRPYELTTRAERLAGDSDDFAYGAVKPDENDKILDWEDYAKWEKRPNPRLLNEDGEYDEDENDVNKVDLGTSAFAGDEEDEEKDNDEEDEGILIPGRKLSPEEELRQAKKFLIDDFELSDTQKQTDSFKTERAKLSKTDRYQYREFLERKKQDMFYRDPEFSIPQLYSYLSNGYDWLTLSHIKKWPYMELFLKDGMLTNDHLRKMFRDAGGYRGRLTLTQFERFLKIVEEEMDLDTSDVYSEEQIQKRIRQYMRIPEPDEDYEDESDFVKQVMKNKEIRAKNREIRARLAALESAGSAPDSDIQEFGKKYAQIFTGKSGESNLKPFSSSLTTTKGEEEEKPQLQSPPVSLLRQRILRTLAARKKIDPLLQSGEGIVSKEEQNEEESKENRKTPSLPIADKELSELSAKTKTILRSKLSPLSPPALSDQQQKPATIVSDLSQLSGQPLTDLQQISPKINPDDAILMKKSFQELMKKNPNRRGLKFKELVEWRVIVAMLKDKVIREDELKEWFDQFSFYEKFLNEKQFIELLLKLKEKDVKYQKRRIKELELEKQRAEKLLQLENEEKAKKEKKMNKKKKKKDKKLSEEKDLKKGEISDNKSSGRKSFFDKIDELDADDDEEGENGNDENGMDGFLKNLAASGLKNPPKEKAIQKNSRGPKKEITGKRKENDNDEDDDEDEDDDDDYYSMKDSYNIPEEHFNNKKKKNNRANQDFEGFDVDDDYEVEYDEDENDEEEEAKPPSRKNHRNKNKKKNNDDEDDEESGEYGPSSQPIASPTPFPTSFRPTMTPFSQLILPDSYKPPGKKANNNNNKNNNKQANQTTTADKKFLFPTESALDFSSGLQKKELASDETIGIILPASLKEVPDFDENYMMKEEKQEEDGVGEDQEKYRYLIEERKRLFEKLNSKNLEKSTNKNENTQNDTLSKEQELEEEIKAFQKTQVLNGFLQKARSKGIIFSEKDQAQDTARLTTIFDSFSHGKPYVRGRDLLNWDLVDNLIGTVIREKQFVNLSLC
jgi:predicted RNA-binding protein with RPS1 domain